MTQGQNRPPQGSAGQPLAAALRSWQAGRLGEAEAALRAILTQSPDQPDALHMLGVIAHQSGRTAAGIGLLERALKANEMSAPIHASIAKLYRASGALEKAINHGCRAVALKHDLPDAHFNLGLARIDAGDLARAIESFDDALRLKPHFAEAANGRGTALKMLGRLAEAEAEYRRALKLTPSYAEALNNLGTVLRTQGRADEALAAFRAALASRPAYVLARNNLILALRDLKQYDEAIAAVGEALRLMPQNADALSYLGAIQLELGDTDAALDALRRSLAINPAKPETHNTLGRALVEAGQTAAAIEGFRRAIALKADFGDPHNNLGNLLRDSGDFSGALAEYETALKLDPAMVAIYGNIAEVKKFVSADDAHLRAMEAQAAAGARVPELHFALGKAYDELGRYDEAFEQLRQANALHRATVAYDEREMLGFFERVAAVFTPELIAARQGGGSASEAPIFVIGMPRSGTTLVEQIIAGHARVASAGETRDLDLTMAAREGRYPENVPALAAPDFAAIGEAYVARLAKRAPDAERIVDKLPTNFHYLGLIHLALPQAKIVHLSRNALDTCFSCFSKLFPAGQNHTYELGELGRYYRAYEKLMEHWRQTLPHGAFLDLEYERLVGDIEGESRRLFDYLGLEWDARVLAFHAREQRVRTASAFQVRQPLYASSVARWRHYEKHLGPLIREVGVR